jgi:predicted chitinase
VLGTLPEGSRIAGDEYAWRHVQGQGLDGWAADEFLEPSTAPGSPQGNPWAHWDAATIASVCKVPQANVEEHWPRICAALAERGIDDRLVQAAAIATVAIETASTFKPVREAFWLSEDWRRANLGRYYPYYGRGEIQLTWQENYANFGNQIGVDLVADPDRALDSEISGQVLALYFDQRGVADAAMERAWGEVRRRVQGGHVGLDRLLVIVNALRA